MDDRKQPRRGRRQRRATEDSSQLALFEPSAGGGTTPPPTQLARTEPPRALATEAPPGRLQRLTRRLGPLRVGEGARWTFCAVMAAGALLAVVRDPQVAIVLTALPDVIRALLAPQGAVRASP